MSDIDKKIILLVDDDQDFIDAYTVVLEKENYEVKSALNSKDGLLSIEKHHPNLIVLDIMMENADSGFEFAQKVKEKGYEIPIILSSSIAKASTALFDIHSLNVKTVLQKPVEFDYLVSSVKKYIN